MSNIKRNIIIIKLLITLFSLILICLVINKTLSKYETSADASGNMQAAFYLIGVEHQSTTIQLSSIKPSDEEFEYAFTVSNNDGTRRTETSLEYELEIVTTTNLPLSYEVYIEKEGQTTENAVTNAATIQDEHGTYFRQFETQQQTFTHTKDETIIYTLVIRFPKTYNSVEYQDIIEMIEINIDSRQII